MKPALDGATMHVALFARLLPFYGLATLLYVVLFMGSTQFAFLLDQNGLVNASTRSLVMCMSTVSGAFASAGYGVVQKRHGALGAFVLGLFAMALALGIAGGTNSVAMAVLAATLVGIYVGLITPYTYHFITEQTDDNSRARAVGFLVAFTFLGAFLNPFLIAPLSALMGLRHVFLCASLFMLVIAAGAVFRSRRNALYALRKEISA
jgi:MFS family permease